MNRARKMVYETEKYIWAMVEQSKSSYTPIVNEKFLKGLKMRPLMQQDLAKTIKVDLEIERLNNL